MNWLRNNSLYFAWLIALCGFCLSLFFGEILKMEPCHLCWYQRIALFPLAIILGIATYRNDRGIIAYVMPIVILGALVALYQTIGQLDPDFLNKGVCGPVEECAEPVFTLFGFITFPLLSAVGFLLIAAFLFLSAIKAD